VKQKIVAVYDSKAGFYMNPIVVKSIGEGERSFANEVNNPQSMLCRNPEDFGLYLVGEYDPITGIIIPEQQPKQLLLALPLKKADLSPAH